MVDIIKTKYEDETPLKQDKCPPGNCILIDSQHANITECELTVAQALRAYSPAVFWSVMVCMCTVMEGYDTILIPSFFAFPTFAKKYGTFNEATGTYQLTAEWQMGLGNASAVMAILGIFCNGYLVSWFGHRIVLLSSLAFLSCAIAVVFVAPNTSVLLVGEMLCGFPWGTIATIAPAYSSEILPLPLRTYLTTCTDFSFVIGQLLAAGTLDGLLSLESSSTYRVAFALQWVWPVFLIPILYFMPESPWRQVRSGKIDEAKKTLARLQARAAKIDIEETLATIIRTNAMEEKLIKGASYRDCFRGTERRRTEIACMAFSGQMLSGFMFAYNVTYFFQQIGIDTKESYQINVGASCVSFCSVLCGWFCVLPYVGRRKIYFWGMTAMSAILFLIGFLSLAGSNDSVGIIQALLTLLWTFIFHLSIGLLGWAIPAEIGSTRLRQKTVCLGRIAFSFANIFSKAVEPYLINPTKLNLKGKTGFFWGVTALLTAIWTFFRLPETKGRTFEELDILFEKKVPTRKFASYKIAQSIDGDEKSV